MSTQRERLNPAAALRRSVTAQATYDEARPSYVQPLSRNARRPYQELAQALAGMDASLSRHLEKKLDRDIEEGALQGNALFTEHGEESGTMRSFKQLSEARPDLVGENPYLEQGYEKARLAELGIRFDRQVQDAFISSGLQNEEDGSKVALFFKEQLAAFRKEHGLENYGDSIRLAQSFAPAVSGARQTLFGEHARAQKAQREAKAQAAYTSRAVQEILRTRDHAGLTPLAFQAERIQAALEEATMHGVRDTQAAGMALDIIDRLEADDPEDLDYLDLYESITVNGVPLLDHAGVAEARNRRLDQHNARELARLNRQNALAERQRIAEERTLPARALRFYLANGNARVTPQGMLEAGFGEREVLKAMQWNRTMKELEADNALDDAEEHALKTEALNRARAGLLTGKDVGTLLTTFGAKEAEKVISMNDKARESEDEAVTKARGKLYAGTVSRFSSAAASGGDDLASLFIGGGSKKKDWQRGVAYATAAATMYDDLVATARKTKQGGAALTELDIQSICMKVEAAISAKAAEEEAAKVQAETQQPKP